MWIYIILIILFFTFSSKIPNGKTVQTKEDKIEKINKTKGIKNLSKLTDEYLSNFNASENKAYYSLFKFLNEIELKTSQESKNFVIVAYNSYKFPEEIIKVVQKHQAKFNDVESIGISVENEIKAFILYLNKYQKLHEFLKTFEYLSEIYYPTDEIITFNVCGKEYLYSQRMSLVLSYLKGDEVISPILYHYNQQMLKCQEVI